MRLTSGKMAILILAMLASLLTGCSFDFASNSDPKEASQIDTPAYTGSTERWSYQQRLNKSAFRIDPVFEIVEYDGALWVRQDIKRGSCEIRCGIATYSNNSYEVHLPVGYHHDSNVSPMPKDLVPISKLVYWSTETHGKVTKTFEGRSRSVGLPFELRDKQGELRVSKGETHYVGAWMVRRDKGGRYFLDPRAIIRSEPLGIEFGYSEDALIVRRTDGKGFEVRLPKGYKPPTQDVEYMIPIMATFAKTGRLVPPSSPSNDVSV